MRTSLAKTLAEYRGLFDSRVWYLTYGQTLLSMGRGVLMPFATLYFYHVLGFPLTLVGLGFALAYPLGALAGLFWGAVADRMGRKPLMIAGFGGQAVTTLALAFVQTPMQYIAVVVANSLMIAAWHPSARAMVADVTPPERRTRAFGLLYMTNNLGMSLGLLLGGLLVVFLPYRALFFAEAAGAAAFLLVVVLLVKESHVPTAKGAGGALEGGLARVASHLRDLSTPLRDRTFLIYLGAGILGGLGWSQFYITYTPFMKDYLGASDPAIGLVIAVNTVMVVALQVPLAAWAERRRKTTVFFVANYLLAWSLVLTWVSGRLDASAMWVLTGAVVIMTVGEIIAAPVGPALTAGLAGGSANFGKYMAAGDLVWSVSSGVGAMIGGAFFDMGRPMLLWPWMTAAVVLSLAGNWILSRRLPAEINAPTPLKAAAPPAAAPGPVAEPAAPPSP